MGKRFRCWLASTNAVCWINPELFQTIDLSHTILVPNEKVQNIHFRIPDTMTDGPAEATHNITPIKQHERTGNTANIQEFTSNSAVQKLSNQS